MTSENFIAIYNAALTVFVIIVANYFIPFIKAKISASELETLTKYISIAVRCAQQIYTIEQWKEKKEYVVNQVKSFINDKLHISITDEQLDSMIEGAVFSMKEAISE